MNAVAIEALPHVRATVQYIAPPIGKPRSLEFEPPPGVPRSTAIYREHQVVISDARPVARSLSLEREGFQLLSAPTTLSDWSDDEAIRDRYYGEATTLLKRATGADRVVVFDHTVRRRLDGAEDRTQGIPRQPVPRVHNDYTVKSGPQRLRDFLGKEAPELLRRRFAIINVWRPLHGPVEDAPLAMVDARSVESGDLVATDLVYPDRIGEIYYVKFNAAHRWYYVPAMRAHEVLLIKCFDSLEDGRARFVPHCAFADPTTPATARPRESIELRTLVLYGADS